MKKSVGANNQQHAQIVHLEGQSCEFHGLLEFFRGTIEESFCRLETLDCEKEIGRFHFVVSIIGASFVSES